MILEAFTFRVQMELMSLHAQHKSDVKLMELPGSNVMPGALLFSTTDTSGSGPHERMRIDGSGQVGIGTGSSIDELLHIESSDTTVRLKVQSTATNFTQECALQMTHEHMICK